MGRKDGAETVGRVYEAFRKERTWTQVALAERAGVEVRALRNVLENMELAGVPLERQVDHPHVYWSVPDGWTPAGVYFPLEEVPALIHQVMRMPSGEGRRLLMERIVRAAPKSTPDGAAMERVRTPAVSEQEETHLLRLMEALEKRRTVRLRYRNSKLGEVVAAVQWIEAGPLAHFVVLYRGDERPKWLRVERVEGLRFDDTIRWWPMESEALHDLVARSINGYAAEKPVRCVFRVMGDDARWVRDSLPGADRERYAVTTIDGGIRVETQTAAVLPLARFVVGLGRSARCQTPELAGLVRELAEGALSGPTE
jgi:predicted DNA-binding transcriptional regulator YafY